MLTGTRLRVGLHAGVRLHLDLRLQPNSRILDPFPSYHSQMPPNFCVGWLGHHQQWYVYFLKKATTYNRSCHITVFNMLVDVALATLPIPIVLRMQLTKRTKIALCTVLLLGFM